MPTIRARTDADLVDLIALLRDVHENAAYPINWPADPKHWLSPSGALGYWVVTVDGEPAGHVAITATNGTALVEKLFVDPEQTGQGLGRHLLDHCVTTAAAEGLDLRLEVAENCHAAIALYARSGWQEIGRAPIDWGGAQASTLITFAAPLP